MNRIIDGFKFGLGFGCAMMVFYLIAIVIVLIFAGVGLLSAFW
jgi:hypothetical protein